MKSEVAGILLTDSYKRLLSKMSGRTIYTDSKGNHYSLDIQQGEFELLDKRGRHQGAINFNGERTKMPDSSGKHNIKNINGQMEENNILYRGAIFTISYFWDREESDSFVLAECQDDDYIFQIICISGYNSGTIMGYIKRGILPYSQRGITYEELVEWIKKNILNPDLSSLRVENEYKIKFE